MPWVATSVNIAKHLTVVLWEVESIKCTASFPCQLHSKFFAGACKSLQTGHSVACMCMHNAECCDILFEAKVAIKLCT